MAFVRTSFGALAFLGLGLGFASACGSSSSGSKPSDGGNGGSTDDGNTAVSSGDDSGMGTPNIGALLGGLTCGPLAGLASMFGGGGGGGGEGGSTKCASGQTCCTMLALPPTASCVSAGSCSGTSNECSAPSDCASGQVCCSGSADGGSPPVPDAGAGGGGIGGLLGGAGLSMFFPSTTCQASCTSLQQQYCSADTDCPAGKTCNAPAGGGAAAGMLPKVCGTPPPEAGTTTPVDAGTTTVVDSGADAPAE